MGGKKLNVSNKLMLRIDNLKNDDINSIEIFKPKEGRNCNIAKLYDTEKEKDGKKKDKNSKNNNVLISSLLILGIIFLVAMGLIILKTL